MQAMKNTEKNVTWNNHWHGNISNVNPIMKLKLDRLALSMLPKKFKIEGSWLDDTSAWKQRMNSLYANYRYTLVVPDKGNQRANQMMARQWSTVFGQVLTENNFVFLSCMPHRTVSFTGAVYYKVDLRFD